jgi:hypothetical protein
MKIKSKYVFYAVGFGLMLSPLLVDTLLKQHTRLPLPFIGLIIMSLFGLGFLLVFKEFVANKETSNLYILGLSLIGLAIILITPLGKYLNLTDQLTRVLFVFLIFSGSIVIQVAYSIRKRTKK